MALPAEKGTRAGSVKRWPGGTHLLSGGKECWNVRIHFSFACKFKVGYFPERVKKDKPGLEDSGRCLGSCAMTELDLVLR